jgi:hypothetical protein
VEVQRGLKGRWRTFTSRSITENDRDSVTVPGYDATHLQQTEDLRPEMASLPLYVDGAERPSAATEHLDVLDPATQQVLCK